jgi:hypothetical protein
VAYVNFCCRSGGSNLNAGTLRGDATVPGTSASFTYASGSWVAGTYVFTVASGNPSSDGVAVGDFASVYPDAATVTPFVAKVTAVSSTTITVSSTVKAGTPPVDGTTNTTLKIGGAWKGPNAAESFPFGFVKRALAESTSDVVRVNLRNSADYNVTASVTHATAEAMIFQGFTTAYGDFGKARINGGGTTTGPLVSAACVLIDLIVYNNSTTGHNYGLSAYNAIRCVCDTIDGGFSATFAVDCIARSCGGSGGIAAFGVTHAFRCIAYNNSGPGFSTASGSFVECISFNNGGRGFDVLNSGNDARVIRCDAYNNGGGGFYFSKTNQAHTNVIEQCNAVKNTGYGIYLASPAAGSLLFASNCRFGAGTAANTSGAISAAAGAVIIESGNEFYGDDDTPWADPANGDFSIALAAAKNIAVPYPSDSFLPGSVSYPDLGAVQATAAGGTAGFTGIRGIGGT